MVKWVNDLFPSGPLSLPLRIVAVLVAASVGALAAGLIVQLLSKGVTRERAPRFAVNLVRVAGGIAAGLATFVLLFGTGGGFGFGGGGTGSGADGGDKDKDKSYSSTPDPRKSDEKNNTNTTKSDPDTLRIEILGNDTLLKIKDAGQPAVKESRRYRVTGPDGSKELLTLPQLEQKLGRSDPVPRQLFLIIYRWDTADSDYTATVRRLEVVAKDLKKVKKEWIDEKVIDSPPTP
jgi:hypothetical protein